MFTGDVDSPDSKESMNRMLTRLHVIERAIQTPGWLTGAEAAWLYDQSRDKHVIVEIGCYQGRSTSILCAGSPGLVISVDDFKGEPTGIADGHYTDILDPKQLEEIKTKLLNHTLVEYVRTGRFLLLEQPAWLAWEILAALLRHRPPDMVFLDGDHSGSGVRFDIMQAQQIISPHGLLCGHDYKPTALPGLCHTVDELLPDRTLVPGTSLWFHQFGD